MLSDFGINRRFVNCRMRIRHAFILFCEDMLSHIGTLCLPNQRFASQSNLRLLACKPAYRLASLDYHRRFLLKIRVYKECRTYVIILKKGQSYLSFFVFWDLDFLLQIAQKAKKAKNC